MTINPENVTKQHPEYQLMKPYWVRNRIFAKGQAAVKQAREQYLPPPIGYKPIGSQDTFSYDEYIKRAWVHPAVERTLIGMAGTIFYTPPDLKNISFDTLVSPNESLGEFLLSLVINSLLVSRSYIFVDAPKDGGDPYIYLVPPEFVTNWSSTSTKEGDFLVVKCFEDIGDDLLSKEIHEFYKVFYIENNSTYVAEIESGNNGFYIRDNYEILLNGEKQSRLPFVLIDSTPSGEGGSSILSPLVDIVESHYRNTADLELGRHLIGLPTPILAGFNIQGPIVLGPFSGYVTPEPNAKAYYMEFKGEGLNELVKALESKEQIMASIGARILETPKTGVESAEAIRLRRTSEMASLQLVVYSINKGLKYLFSQYSNLLFNKEVEVILNNDFTFSQLSHSELTAYVKAWIDGAFSWETLFLSLQKGGIIPKSVNPAEERKKILEGGMII